MMLTPKDERRFRSLFAMPKPVKITGRSSSITNSFVNGVIPVVVPSGSDVHAALDILGMEAELCCAYCGGASTEWDHLRPLVMSKRPTGYISEIQNLVPACGKCNQSKGNKHWRDWMFGDARLSPKTRGVQHLERRAARLERFEAWMEPTRIDFQFVSGDELWAAHWENHQNLIAMMQHSELVAAQIRERILRHAKNQERSSAG